MANWGITDLVPLLYTDVAKLIIDRDVDSATMFLTQPTNPPVGAVRWNRQTNRFEEFDATGNWNAKIIAISGGGTGGSDASSARASLGIGTMGQQNANAVAITGGTGIFSSITMGGHILFQASNIYNIGSSIQRAGRVYIGGGVVFPVGADKWVPV